ncbi:hypothetical protein PENTCL1PPCAC_15517, partial [Pristionchus entomophagus]
MLRSPPLSQGDNLIKNTDVSREFRSEGCEEPLWSESVLYSYSVGHKITNSTFIMVCCGSS